MVNLWVPHLDMYMDKNLGLRKYQSRYCQIFHLMFWMCWEEYNNKSLLTDYLCMSSAWNMARSGEIICIVYAYFVRTQFGVNWCIYMKIWRNSLTYYLPNERTLKVLLTHQTVYRDTLWHNSTNVRPFPDGKVLTFRTPYGNTVQYYWLEIL